MTVLTDADVDEAIRETMAYHPEDAATPAPEEHVVSGDPECWVNAIVIDDEDGEA